MITPTERIPPAFLGTFLFETLRNVASMHARLDIEMVDFLQGQIACFWVAEVDKWDEGEVGAHED